MGSAGIVGFFLTFSNSFSMFNLLFLDIPRVYQMTFQDTATPVMSAILDLHSYISVFLILILIFVAFQIFDVLHFFRIDRDYNLKNLVFKTSIVL